jgi:hypothetical protein
MDSVRQDGESRLKTPNFNRGAEKILSVTESIQDTSPRIYPWGQCFNLKSKI